ncbi:protein IE [Gallid alphaherpesvirus 1]|uniref:Protein IE n=1 Tax=Infectious laryngotracheitis virus TaxID=10386 RepID=A0A0K0K714_ILTV|nr:protein IE [Gallid alphaherpesvirus 1]
MAPSKKQSQASKALSTSNRECRFAVTHCLANFVDSSHMELGTHRGKLWTEKVEYGLAVLHGTASFFLDCNKDLTIHVFQDHDSKQPDNSQIRFVAAPLFEDAQESLSNDTGIPSTAIIMTRTPYTTNSNLELGVEQLLLAMKRASLKNFQRWQAVADSVHSKNPMTFGAKYLPFKLLPADKWKDGVGFLMLGLISDLELSPVVAAVRAFSGALFFQSPPSLTLSGETLDLKHGDSPHHSPVGLLRAAIFTGLRAYRSQIASPIITCREEWAFRIPFCVAIGDSQIHPPRAQQTASIPKGTHILCAFFPVSGVLASDERSYLAVDTWASRATSWLTGRGFTFWRALLEETPMCGKFLCAAICHAYDPPRLGILLHSHWTPDEIGDFKTAACTAVSEAWKNMGIATLPDLFG